MQKRHLDTDTEVREFFQRPNSHTFGLNFEISNKGKLSCTNKFFNSNSD